MKSGRNDVNISEKISPVTLKRVPASRKSHDHPLQLTPLKITLKSRLRTDQLVGIGLESEGADDRSRTDPHANVSLGSLSKASSVSRGGIARILDNAMRQQGLGHWNRDNVRKTDSALLFNSSFNGTNSFLKTKEKLTSTTKLKDLIDSDSENSKSDSRLSISSGREGCQNIQEKPESNQGLVESPGKRVRRPPPAPSFAKSASNPIKVRTDILVRPKGEIQKAQNKKGFDDSRESAGKCNDISHQGCSSSEESDESPVKFVKFRSMKTRLSTIMNNLDKDKKQESTVIGVRSADQQAGGLVRVLGGFEPGAVEKKFTGYGNWIGKTQTFKSSPESPAKVPTDVQSTTQVTKNYDQRDREVLRMISAIPGVMKIKFMDKEKLDPSLSKVPSKQAMKIKKEGKRGSLHLSPSSTKPEDNLPKFSSASFNFPQEQVDFSQFVLSKKQSMFSASSMSLQQGHPSQFQMMDSTNSPQKEDNPAKNFVKIQKSRLLSEGNSYKAGQDSRPPSLTDLKKSPVMSTTKVARLVLGSPNRSKTDIKQQPSLKLKTSDSPKMQIFFGGGNTPMSPAETLTQAGRHLQSSKPPRLSGSRPISPSRS